MHTGICCSILWQAFSRVTYSYFHSCTNNSRTVPVKQTRNINRLLTSNHWKCHSEKKKPPWWQTSSASKLALKHSPGKGSFPSPTRWIKFNLFCHYSKWKGSEEKGLLEGREGFKSKVNCLVLNVDISPGIHFYLKATSEVISMCFHVIQAPYLLEAIKQLYIAN